VEWTLPGRGYVQITGLAWSGGGAVSKVEVSTDGGQELEGSEASDPGASEGAHPGLPLTGVGDGEEAVLMSRCTDDQGDVQPSKAELYINTGGITELEKAQPHHSFQCYPTLVRGLANGSVHDAMFA